MSLIEVTPWLGGGLAAGAMALYIRRHRDFLREDSVGLLFVAILGVLAAKWALYQFGIGP